MHAMEIFYSQWIIEEGRLLNDLSSVPQNSPDLHMSTLISRALSHYAEYCDRLSQLAEQNIFLVFSAYWLNPIEHTFFWLGGLKPSMLFHLITSNLNDDQRREIEKLKQQTVQRETELETMMYEAEGMITALMATEAMQGNPQNGEVRADLAIMVADMISAVFDEANKLRKHVMLRNFFVLNAAQMVKFLARLANHHLWIHQLAAGEKCNGERQAEEMEMPLEPERKCLSSTGRNDKHEMFEIFGLQTRIKGLIDRVFLDIILDKSLDWRRSINRKILNEELLFILKELN